jgi:hypothetical protein
VPKENDNPKTVASPSATGNAGAGFEAKLGAFYLLALLTSGEPRCLPNAVCLPTGASRGGTQSIG